MSNQRYANVANPHINALVSGRYRFEHEGQAADKLAFFKESFTTARQEDDPSQPDKPCLVMWIKDYALTKEDEKSGFVGHYVFITPKRMPTGIYTLETVKLDTELKYHPRRKRKKERLPNWGHPILRSVKKQKHYATLEEIQLEFDQLHMEYPETTIPGDNKLLLMIFDRQADPKNPAQKYVLKIIPHKEGGYTFEWKLNDYEGRMGPRADAKKLNAEEMPPGYFTSMVSLKRKNPVKSGNNGEN